jgi:hypothetical protein
MMPTATWAAVDVERRRGAQRGIAIDGTVPALSLYLLGNALVA